MPSLVNRLIVKELTSEFQGVDGFMFVSWGTLNAVENEGLRDKLADPPSAPQVVLTVRGKGYMLADGGAP